VSRHAPAGLILEIDIGQRLARSIDDREAFAVFLNAPRRREAALSHGQPGSEPSPLRRAHPFEPGADLPMERACGCLARGTNEAMPEFVAKVQYSGRRGLQGDPVLVEWVEALLVSTSPEHREMGMSNPSTQRVGQKIRGNHSLRKQNPHQRGSYRVEPRNS
jgi:hypothetical protein